MPVNLSGARVLVTGATVASVAASSLVPLARSRTGPHVGGPTSLRNSPPSRCKTIVRLADADPSRNDDRRRRSISWWPGPPTPDVAL